jgi:predicted dehydrogenase
VTRLRIGILGAARIAPNAIIEPAKAVDEVTVTTVAARDPARAAAFAATHDLVTRPSYGELVADPDIEAVYVPLPNGLHAEWTIRALEAGKHVLCEKPFAANEDEARQMAEAADRSGLVLMEAFHYRYHPLAERLIDIVHGGEIGEVRSVRTWMCFPLPRFGDIRYDYSLAGGAMMDAGCYALHLLRVLGPGEPTVTEARAALHSPTVDRAMTVHLSYPDGAVARMDASMWSHRLLHVSARVVGSRGDLSVLNYAAPHIYHRVRLRSGGRTRRFKVPGEPTYTCQLRAFAAAMGHGAPTLTPPADSIATMALIDASYQAAGLLRRGEPGV